MKIAVQYLDKMFLFNINKVEKIEEVDNFFSSKTDYYISSKDGKIHKQKMSENIIYYIDNNIIYSVTNSESLKEFLNIENIKSTIKENLKTFKIDEDLSELTSNETSFKLKNMLAEKEIKDKKDQEIKDKKEKDRIAKIEAEEEAEKQQIIKDGIEKIKNNEIINSKTFEILLNHFDINIHIRTLHWIRNSLVCINKDTYRICTKSKSTKVFELYNELVKKVNLMVDL